MSWCISCPVTPWRLIVREGGVISAQVLNELTNVARRKVRVIWQSASNRSLIKHLFRCGAYFLFVSLRSRVTG